jgi:copper chaperone
VVTPAITQKDSRPGRAPKPCTGAVGGEAQQYVIHMEILALTVSGMSCEHCATAIRGEVQRLPGVTTVDVDIEGGTVTVSGEPLPAANSLRAAVEEAGYEVITAS